MPRHRRTPAPHESARPRYRRITAACASALVTTVAVLGATGVLPTSGSPETAFAAVEPPEPHSAAGSEVVPEADSAVRASLPRHLGRGNETRLPKASGEGKRIVFDMEDQRVWLVGRGDEVRRTYLVSGSLTDNLDAGSYEVYSKSLDAIGIDDSGTMRYMVRFARGDHAAIGFHDIPIHEGEPVQTVDELGTPQSHGCIRQQRKDAKALWRFAPVGTKVVVL